jgi:hypothetical protein
MWLLNFLKKDRRHFYRHPIHLPINLSLDETRDSIASETGDISLGGLRFRWSQQLITGSLVDIDIPVKEKHFVVKARVAYCRQENKDLGFQAGVTFADPPSAFKAKLAEEVLDILEYQKRLSEKNGSPVTEEEAASRWITEKAKKFPLRTIS